MNLKLGAAIRSWLDGEAVAEAVEKREVFEEAEELEHVGAMYDGVWKAEAERAAKAARVRDWRGK